MEVVEVSELEWPFEGGPRMRAGDFRREAVDPFPGYRHPTPLVQKLADELEQKVPLYNSPVIYNLNHEPTTRTNGWAERSWSTASDDKWSASIVLCGKRIPLHPAMTRYLVPHEYGHHVEYELERILGYEHGDNLVRYEYQKVRGGSMKYGGGKWHENVGELFANDFRMVMGYETEFWPHPGFKPYYEIDGLANWWTVTLNEIRKANT
jgi:hypothetical protein